MTALAIILALAIVAFQAGLIWAAVVFDEVGDGDESSEAY